MVWPAEGGEGEGGGGASKFQTAAGFQEKVHASYLQKRFSDDVLGLPSSPSLTFPEISRQNRKHHQKKTAPSCNNPTERRSSLTPVSCVLPSHPEFKAA